MTIQILRTFCFLIAIHFTSFASAQGLEACLELQKKNPEVKDPIREILTSDFQCTIPSWAPRVFLMSDDPAEVFFAPCLIHDLCYKHGSYTYSKTRKDCDNEFGDKMRGVCETRYQDESQLRCLIDAHTLHETTRQVGFLFYLSPPGYNDFPPGIEPFTNDHGTACRYLD
jgi:hypothetical protein